MDVSLRWRHLTVQDASVFLNAPNNIYAVVKLNIAAY